MVLGLIFLKYVSDAFEERQEELIALFREPNDDVYHMPRADYDSDEAFPDTLVESELGMIPEGWGVKPLSETIEILSGGTPKRSETEYWDGDIPWFTVKDAPADGDIWVVDTDEKISAVGLAKSPARLLPIGATIISARGTVGKLALVGTAMAMNQSCYGILPRDGKSSTSITSTYWEQWTSFARIPTARFSIR